MFDPPIILIAQVSSLYSISAAEHRAGTGTMDKKEINDTDQHRFQRLVKRRNCMGFLKKGK